ncbi:MAG TPA: M48 family metallopeptidase [Pyrinomonadaceae bacterium]
MLSNNRPVRFVAVWAMALMMLAAPLAALAQTQVVMPKNKYNVNDDVKLGQQAAQQAEQQLPVLRDESVESYVARVGQRLVSAIPPQFQQPQFQYRFRVIDARDINAFALPGGPMYVNRGMIEAARTEGEMAGVMAHEISHVALRHATAQATETQKFQIGSVLGQIAGAVIGGPAGAVIGTASQIGFGAGALKYSRKYETQADILGSQIMARAGYDPRDLANMFRTIEGQGGGARGPEWMSSHPNPGNRYERINQEAAMLRVSNPNRDMREFSQIQARLRGQPRARSMEEIARSGQTNPQGTRYPDNRYPDNRDTRYPSGERVAYPSTRLRAYQGSFFRLGVPDNWRELGGQQNAVTFAPDGAYSQQGEFTHGMMVGIAPAQSRDLRGASDEFLQGLLQGGNSYLRPQSRGYQRASIGGRSALAMPLTGRSPLTGQNEYVVVYTTQLRDGNVFYLVTVAPQSDYNSFERAFRSVLSSVQLND